MPEKICVITGATSGIGLGIAHRLAEQGAGLILIGRNEAKGNEIIKILKDRYSPPLLKYYRIDLASMAAIRAQGEIIRQDYPAIDVLVNNAGIWTSSLELTEEGIERQFAVNHLAYFLLTHILYSSLANANQAQVINMGSNAYGYGKINLENHNLENEYHGLKAYGQSKLANLLFTRELERRKQHEHINTYCVSPGLVKTDIGVKHTNPFHGLMWKLRRMSGKTPYAAAATVADLIYNQDAKENSGLYWENSKIKPTKPEKLDPTIAADLWTLSESLCGIDNYFQVR